jgi:hypothetical protein
MTFSQHPVQNANDIREVNANAFSQKINVIYEQMQAGMTGAQKIQTEQGDKHQREGVEMEIQTRVWMDVRNIATQ